MQPQNNQRSSRKKPKLLASSVTTVFLLLAELHAGQIRLKLKDFLDETVYFLALTQNDIGNRIHSSLKLSHIISMLPPQKKKKKDQIQQVKQYHYGQCIFSSDKLSWYIVEKQGVVIFNNKINQTGEQATSSLKLQKLRQFTPQEKQSIWKFFFKYGKPKLPPLPPKKPTIPQQIHKKSDKPKGILCESKTHNLVGVKDRPQTLVLLKKPKLLISQLFDVPAYLWIDPTIYNSPQQQSKINKQSIMIINFFKDGASCLEHAKKYEKNKQIIIIYPLQMLNQLQNTFSCLDDQIIFTFCYKNNRKPTKQQIDLIYKIQQEVQVINQIVLEELQTSKYIQIKNDFIQYLENYVRVLIIERSVFVEWMNYNYKDYCRNPRQDGKKYSNFISMQDEVAKSNFHNQASNFLQGQATDSQIMIQNFMNLIKLVYQDPNQHSKIIDQIQEKIKIMSTAYVVQSGNLWHRDRFIQNSYTLYTGQSFQLYKIINKFLGFSNCMTELMYIQPFFNWLYIAIRCGTPQNDIESNSTKNTSLMQKTQIYYRGGQISDDELNYYKQNINCIVQNVTFFSTSEKREVAIDWVENILFEVKVRQKYNKLNNIIQQSGYSKIQEFTKLSGEKEVVFNPLCTFEITGIREQTSKNGNLYHIIQLEYGQKTKFIQSKISLDDYSSSQWNTLAIEFVSKTWLEQLTQKQRHYKILITNQIISKLYLNAGEENILPYNFFIDRSNLDDQSLYMYWKFYRNYSSKSEQDQNIADINLEWIHRNQQLAAQALQMQQPSQLQATYMIFRFFETHMDPWRKPNNKFFYNVQQLINSKQIKQAKEEIDCLQISIKKSYQLSCIYFFLLYQIKDEQQKKEAHLMLQRAKQTAKSQFGSKSYEYQQLLMLSLVEYEKDEYKLIKLCKQATDLIEEQCRNQRTHNINCYQRQIMLLKLYHLIQLLQSFGFGSSAKQLFVQEFDLMFKYFENSPSFFKLMILYAKKCEQFELPEQENKVKELFLRRLSAKYKIKQLEFEVAVYSYFQKLNEQIDKQKDQDKL